MRKMAFSDPDYIDKSSRSNIDNFIEGNSDHLPLVVLVVVKDLNSQLRKYNRYYVECIDQRL